MSGETSGADDSGCEATSLIASGEGSDPKGGCFPDASGVEAPHPKPFTHSAKIKDRRASFLILAARRSLMSLGRHRDPPIQSGASPAGFEAEGSAALEERGGQAQASVDVGRELRGLGADELQDLANHRRAAGRGGHERAAGDGFAVLARDARVDDTRTPSTERARILAPALKVESPEL